MVCVLVCILVCMDVHRCVCPFEVIVTHKAAGIVVAHSLGIAESFKQWV